MKTKRPGWGAWVCVGLAVASAVLCAWAILDERPQVAAVLAFSAGVCCMWALRTAEDPIRRAYPAFTTGKPRRCGECPIAILTRDDAGASRLRCASSGEFVHEDGPCKIDSGQAKALLAQAMLILAVNARKDA